MRRVWVVLVVACSYAPVRTSGVDVDAPPDDPPDSPRDARVACPVEFVTLAGAPSKYRASTIPQSFAAAVETCSGLGPNVHLARVDTQAEVDALAGVVGALFRVVGSRHTNNPGSPLDDTWHDLDDVTPLVFLPWGMNEPTNLVGELCMGIRDEFGGGVQPKVAGADDCTTERLFVCECE